MSFRPIATRAAAGYIWLMFGIGPQELVVIGLLVLVIFGPRKLPQMVRDLSRFVTEARHSAEEFKDELIPDDHENEDRRPERKRYYHGIVTDRRRYYQLPIFTRERLR